MLFAIFTSNNYFITEYSILDDVPSVKIETSKQYYKYRVKGAKMTYDLPCMSYMAMYIISLHIVHSNSRSSVGANHWRLNIEEGKVLQAEDDKLAGNVVDDDPMFKILTNKRQEEGQWLVDSHKECIHCREMEHFNQHTERFVSFLLLQIRYNKKFEMFLTSLKLSE